eukprot:gene4477-5489_t
MSVVSDATSYFSAGDNMTMSMAMEVVEEDETKEELGVSVFADIDGMAVRVTEAADERLYAAVNATTASYADADQLRFGIHLRYDGDEQLLVHGVNPRVSSAGALEVLSGSCTAVDGCVRSPNYPQNYGANEICTMQASQEGYLDVHFFNIHATDGLYVDDVKYEGDSMPALYVDAATALRYESDGAGSAAGFYICLTGDLPRGALPAPLRYAAERTD